MKKNNSLFLIMITLSCHLHSAEYHQTLPPRGTAGNQTVKQKIELSLHNAGADIRYTTKNIWDSLVSKTQDASLSLQTTAKNLKTKYDASDIASSFQSVSSKTSQSIKDFWNQLTGKTKTFSIIHQETNNLDDVFSPLQTSDQGDSDVFL